MSEAEVEAEIQAKGKTAPRITPEHVDEQIRSEVFWHPGRDAETLELAADASPEERALSCLTVCALVLKNGFTVTGESACASPENFDAELGRKIAYRNAREKIWALEGYQLRTRLALAGQQGQ